MAAAISRRPETSNNAGQINVTGADTIEIETGLVTIFAGKNGFSQHRHDGWQSVVERH